MRTAIGLFGMLWLAACAYEDDPSKSISPTGTYLEPQDGLGEEGYAVLDEVCENVDSKNYINRYVTPMFRDSAVVNDVVYLVDGSLLWAIDISDPKHPERLSMTRLSGHPVSIAATDNGELAVVDGMDTLSIIDVSDPTAPEVVGTLGDLPGTPLDVAVSGNRAFVAAGDSGLLLIDISDPKETIFITKVSVRGFANAVASDGETAYVAACDTVSIIDISNDEEIETLARVSIPEGHARELAVAEDTLLVAAGEALFSIDITDKASPELDGFYTDLHAEGFYVNAVTARGDIAYIAAGDESFRSVRISQMSDIDEYELTTEISFYLEGTATLDPPGTIMVVTGDPIGIRLYGDLLLVLGNFRWVGERLLRIVDVSDPGDITDVGRYAQPIDMSGAAAMNEEVLLYYGDGAVALHATDGEQISTFDLPRPVIRTETTDDVILMLLENGDVYRTTDFDAFAKVAENASDLAAHGDIAAMSSALDNGIYPVPISANPDYFDPEGVASNQAFLGFSRLIVAHNRIYAYDWALGRLHVIKPDKHDNLEYIGFVYLGQCEAYDVADTYSGTKNDKTKIKRTSEGLVMLCPEDELGLASLRLINLNDPNAPKIEDIRELPEGRYNDFHMENDVFYTVGFDNNHYVSTLERFEGDDHHVVSFDGRAMGLAVIDDTIIVADGDFGMRRFTYTDGTLAPVDAI